MFSCNIITGLCSQLSVFLELLTLAVRLHSCYLLTLSLVHSVDAIPFNEVNVVKSADLCQEKSHWNVNWYLDKFLNLEAATWLTFESSKHDSFTSWNSNVFSTEVIFIFLIKWFKYKKQKAGLTIEWSGMLENWWYVAFSLLLKYFCKCLYLSSPALRWSTDDSEVSWNKTTL